MGNSTTRESITIEIDSRQPHILPNSSQSNPEKLTFPSFLQKSKTNHDIIQYSQRCSFQLREYEFDYDESHGQSVIKVKRLSNNSKRIWKVIDINDRVQINEGNFIKIGNIEFTVKKICSSYADLEEENSQTLTEIGSQSILQRSDSNKFLKNSKCLYKNESVESIGLGTSIERELCRVCFNHNSTKSNPLLSLCKCSGSIKFIHYQCLKAWVQSRSKCKSTRIFQYFEYDSSCDVCKQKIQPEIEHNNRKYIVYGQTKMHPPFIILSQVDEQDKNRVRDYLINFYNQNQVKIGKGDSCDVSINHKSLNREHCELIMQNKSFYLQNLSLNQGTLIEMENELLAKKQDDLKLVIGNNLVTFRHEDTTCFTFNNSFYRLRLERQE